MSDLLLQASDAAAITLQPGGNRLAFRLGVMKQGLYVLKHAHFRLGRLALRLRAALPEDGGPPLDLLTALPPVLPPAAAESQFPGSGPAVGAVDTLGARLNLFLSCNPKFILYLVACFPPVHLCIFNKIMTSNRPIRLSASEDKG